jgi:DNA repair protein RadC
VPVATSVARLVPTPRAPDPSAEDVRCTKSLVQAGKLMDLEVVDHIVVSQNRYCSLKERGLGFDE